MNIYFLLEGLSTETKFYPELIGYIFDDRLSRIYKIDEVTGKDHSYFILSGNGYPQIYTHILTNTIQDIIQYQDFTQLFVCIDADELSINERVEEFDVIYNNLVREGLDISGFCEVTFIVQNRCIETWFLGNKRAYKQNSSNSEMLKFNRFYNVKTHDPEHMGFNIGYDNHASYHYSYLKQMIRENRKQYTKSNPTAVCEALYISRLEERFVENQHIKSFGYLLNKLYQLNDKLLNGS